MSRLRYGLVAACAALPFAAIAQPAVTPDNRTELRAEIKQRCQSSMSEYGADMTLACMEQDWEGAQEVMDYQRSHPDITKRCLTQMRSYGFDMVSACVEQDAGASSKIENW